MPTNTILYDAARKYLGDGTIDFDTDSLNVALLTSGYTPRSAAVWSATVTYALGTVVTYGGRHYEALTAGVSAGAAPLFPTIIGGTVTDNTVAWYCWGYAPPSTHTVFADVSASELPTAGGYTAGGAALTGKAVTTVLHSARYSASPVRWSGSTFTARYAVIYKVGTVNSLVNPLLLYVLLDSTNADVSVPSAAAFSLSWPTTGVFTHR